MGELLDVRLACCVLYRKSLIAALKPLSSREKLEFIAENTETVKEQIQKVLKAVNCKIVELSDEIGTDRMTVKNNCKIRKGGVIC